MFKVYIGFLYFFATGHGFLSGHGAIFKHTLQQRYNKYPDIAKVFERFSKLDELGPVNTFSVHQRRAQS